MGLERVRNRNRMLVERGQLPGSSPLLQQTSKPRIIKGAPLELPCIHEGAILEYCHSRRGELAEPRHVRDCDIHQKCTRGFVSNLVTWCGRCQDYKADDPTSESTPATCAKPLLEHQRMTDPGEATLNIDFTHLSPEAQVAGDTLPDDQRLRKKHKRAPVWMYGVTTVPERRGELLPRTLKSLQGAGFPEPTIFVDGDWDYKSWHDEFNLPLVMRYPRLRVFGNWSLALAELYLRNPNATYYAIFQDDMIVSRNLRAYIDAIQFPDKGYLNLYTFPKNQVLAHGRVGFYPSNQKGKGAVGLIFNLEGVQMLLQHNHMIGRVRDITLGHKFVDGSIVESMKKAGWKEYVHNPSIVQHLGFKTTTGNPKQPQATSFKGEDFDLLSLLRKS